MFNAAHTVEILRIGRVTSTKIIFINHCSTLISRMINKEGNANTISKTLSKTFGRHIQTFCQLFAKHQNLQNQFALKATTFDCFGLDRLSTNLQVLIPFGYLAITQTLGFGKAESLSVCTIKHVYATVRSQVLAPEEVKINKIT